MSENAKIIPISAGQKKPTISNKEVFDVQLDDDKVLKMAVERPKQRHLVEAQKVYNQTFRNAIESNAIVRARLDKEMYAQKLWDKTKQDRADELQKKIQAGECRLNAGGVRTSEGRKIAINLMFDRQEFRELNADRNNLDANTAEAQAENARFNALVAECTVYDTNGTKYFKGYNDYVEKPDDKVGQQAATKLAFMVYGLDPNFTANLPENRFLRRFGFMDDSLKHLRPGDKKFIRLYREYKEIIDANGKVIKDPIIIEKLVNEKGELINENNQLVDYDGHPLNKDGYYVADTHQPFLDEDGVPIIDAEEKRLQEKPAEPEPAAVLSPAELEDEEADKAWDKEEVK